MPLSTASAEWVDRHPPIVKVKPGASFHIPMATQLAPVTITGMGAGDPDPQHFVRALWQAWYHRTWCKGTCGHTFSW